MPLSDNLQFLRARQGLTQEQLAEQLDVSRQSVSKWESAASFPEMDTLLKLCDMFHTDLDTLLRGSVEQSLSEDTVAFHEDYAPRKVLNQWTFQARMYNAARYVCEQPDMQLVQLVSFGCGTDAITGDEVRSILEEGGKLYTQLKIDDISNLGAVKIRIRSLMAAMEERKRHDN